MDKIAYFGTQGCAGHYPLGINYYMSTEEYNKLNEIDGEWFFALIRQNRSEEHKCSYWVDEFNTYYCLLYSVDDHRCGCHTDLIVQGNHTIEEMETIINGNDFLKKQFDVKRRFPDKDGKTA